MSNVTADEIVEARAAGLLDPRAETADDKPTPQPSADQGAGDTPVIGTKGWLRTASPAEISAALTRGDLDTLLAGTRPQQ